MNGPLQHVRLFIILAVAVWLVSVAFDRRVGRVMRMSAGIGALGVGVFVWRLS